MDLERKVNLIMINKNLKKYFNTIKPNSVFLIILCYAFISVSLSEIT